MPGGVYVGQNTLRAASVEFVRLLERIITECEPSEVVHIRRGATTERTRPAACGGARNAQFVATRTQRSGSRLRACQKYFFDKLSGTPQCGVPHSCKIVAAVIYCSKLSVKGRICFGKVSGMGAAAAMEYGLADGDDCGGVAALYYVS